MNDDKRQPDTERLESTIEPVRRPQAETAERDARPFVVRRRGPLVGAAVLLAVAGIVMVFVYLPAWVERASAPEPVAAVEEPVPAAPAEPALTPEQIAALRAEAEALLAELLEQQQALLARSAQSWGQSSWELYEQSERLASDAFLAEDFEQAVAQYEAALATGAELLARSEQIMADALTAGEEAIAVGNPELAIEQFDLVLAVDPNNARAQRGRARAADLPRVLDAMRRGDAARDRGALDEAAAAYREALAIDSNFEAARRSLSAVTTDLANSRFDRLISSGFAAIEAGRYEAAVEQFNEALGLRPDSPVARDGLEQAEQQRLLNEILMAEVRGQAFERRELWDEAIARYEDALAIDPTLQFAIDGLARAQARADLDAKLSALIDNPRLLLTDEVLGEARSLVSDARAIDDPGPRLSSQLEELDNLIVLASTPIDVQFVSDGLTQVTVYRVGDLGSFQTKEVSLRPGSYTAIGMRRGYRDVRQNFDVLPGNNNGPVTVICVEPI
ncbi:MAG: tetratricopeptide repeat protein [Gammaproteobacteria bacterium]|nr:tetratricopeptide repeat protein [Gammaproteobacteria bacterium]